MGAHELGDAVGEDDAAARAERDDHLAYAEPRERTLVVAVDEQLRLVSESFRIETERRTAGS